MICKHPFFGLILFYDFRSPPFCVPIMWACHKCFLPSFIIFFTIYYIKFICECHLVDFSLPLFVVFKILFCVYLFSFIFTFVFVLDVLYLISIEFVCFSFSQTSMISYKHQHIKVLSILIKLKWTFTFISFLFVFFKVQNYFGYKPCDPKMSANYHYLSMIIHFNIIYLVEILLKFVWF